ncbi:MAG: VanZ family protein, partial [Candidatus Electrothrix sp. AR3]|nr:VanZ family protein [Candidatus Electrothrix sp. AR3]
VVVRPVAEFLRRQNILAAIILALFFLAAPAILLWRYAASSRKTLLLRVSLLLLLLIIAYFLSGTPEERLHFLTYGLLGWLISWTLEVSQRPFPQAAAWILPSVLVWLAGAGDELIQWWLPMRVFDLRDIAFNGLAGMAGMAIFATGERKKVVLDGV